MYFAKPINGEERDLMVATYDAIEGELESERQALLKLRLQKSGLMQDLLSGKVSVAPLLEQAAA